MKLFISPTYHGIDKGTGGGIRRIVERQLDYFASSIVTDVNDADTVALHAGSLVKLRTDQKVISHCHGLYWAKYTNWEQPADDINKAVIEAMRLSDFITAPTQWVADSLRRGMYRPVDVVPHAVDSAEWQPGKTNKGYVLWNKSREDRVCDPDDVYNVASKLSDVEFHLTVPKKGRQASKNITITGLTPYADKTPVQEAGVYLATAQETFGIGILEALACGVPVVGWDWGGQAEILPKTWLAPTGDFDKLAELIRWALKTNLHDQCLEIASRYTWQAAMEMYEEIYSRDISCERRISVVIRNYNQSDLLAECIESVLPEVDLEQDEVIVLDDCSEDTSSEVAAGYGGITWIQTPHNLGIALAQDYGISRAKGRYIVPIDSDNMLMPNSLKLLYDALEADRKIDIAYGRIKWLGINGSSWPPDKFDIDKQLSHKNQIPCTCMYRRKVYDVAGPYRARCKVAEDADFWCRATSLGFVPKKVVNTETFVYRARIGSSSQVIKDWPWEQWYDWRGSPPFAAVGNTKPRAHSCEPTLVSIIIPVGPGHEYLLQDAIDSIYTQTFKNWECIVVNDTGDEIPWKLPPWVRVINTVGGDGPAIARNLGLDFARGALFVPLDADDYLTTTALEDMLKLWKQNKQHYIYTDFYKGPNVHKAPDMACQIIRNQMPHILPGLYPIKEDVRFNDVLGEDWDFVLQMQETGTCGIRLDKPVVRYRIESGFRRESWTSANRQVILEKWKDSKLAGCSSCAQRAAAMRASMQPLRPESGNVVLVEYTGTDNKRYFPGVVSGRTYAFGTGQGLREKYVLVEDISGFSGKANFVVHSDVENNTPVPV